MVRGGSGFRAKNECVKSYRRTECGDIPGSRTFVFYSKNADASVMFPSTTGHMVSIIQRYKNIPRCF